MLYLWWHRVGKCKDAHTKNSLWVLDKVRHVPCVLLDISHFDLNMWHCPLVWYCSYTQKFWKDIYQWITQNTTLNKSIAFSPLICLGLIDNISDLLLHHLFLIAKRYIYTCKLNNCNPALQVYIQTVMNSMEIEKEIASNNNNMSSFKNKWSPLKLCPLDK